MIVDTGIAWCRPKWAIIELNDDDPGMDMALAFESLDSFSITATADAPSEAVENGSFMTYNKVSSAREIKCTLVRAGTPDLLEGFLILMDKWRSQAILLNFLTPEIEYPDLTLVSYGYTCNKGNGRGVLCVDLVFREVRQVESQYTTVDVPAIPIKQVKKPQAASCTGGTPLPTRREERSISPETGCLCKNPRSELSDKGNSDHTNPKWDPC